MSEDKGRSAPVSGSCERCRCALGYIACERDGAWFCCGACAGSDRCSCGCKADLTKPGLSDSYIPTRRMFASRHPDGLKTNEGETKAGRAFPFADSRRGR